MMEDDENRSEQGRKKRGTGVPTSPKAREDRIIAKAMDLAERKIEDGTASSQLICHFLKLKDPDEDIRHEILERQRDLIVEKTENLKAQRRTEAALDRVVRAMKRYSGYSDDLYDGDEEEF